MPGERAPINLGIADEHIHDVALAAPCAGALDDVQDLIAALHHAFTEQETRREFTIMSGRAHDHGDIAPLHTNLQRLLARGQVIRRCRRAIGLHANHLHGGGELVFGEVSGRVHVSKEWPVRWLHVDDFH